jgi:hypothetical protein
MGSLTVFNLFTGLIMIALGIYYRYRTPRYGSWFFGFLHPFARKNEEVWKEAHRYAGLPLIVVGVVLLLSSSLPYLLSGYVYDKPATGLIIGGTLVIVLLTKRHIERTFDENGQRRH